MKLRRIFVERGHDFFEAHKNSRTLPPLQSQDAALQEEDSTADDTPAETSHTMTPEELYKMRMNLLPQL